METEFVASKETIEQLKNDLNADKSDENSQMSASAQLLEEANKNLKKAIAKNDFSAAKVAQTMIEGLMKPNEEYKKKIKAVDSLETKLNRKKDSMITSFKEKNEK